MANHKWIHIMGIMNDAYNDWNMADYRWTHIYIYVWMNLIMTEGVGLTFRAWWMSRASSLSLAQHDKSYLGLSENVGLIFPMIASHLKTGFHDQQNHWVFRGLANIFRQTHFHVGFMIGVERLSPTQNPMMSGSSGKPGLFYYGKTWGVYPAVN